MSSGKQQGHRSVLLDDAIEALKVRPDGIYIDGTYGRGGHSSLLMSKLGADGRLMAIDKDAEAITDAEQRFAGDHRFTIVRGSFAMLAEFVQQRGWQGQVDGILLDLGVSSPQLDEAARGFSFMQSGPLDMRMDTSRGESAAEWLAHCKEAELIQVLKEYGEERFAKRIARAIVRERETAAIETTDRLAAIIDAASPGREPGKHPATRSFQAIRIFINNELGDLQHFLEQVLDVLAVGGRLVVISFHSLEDRIVKRYMRKLAKGDDFPPDLPVTQAQLSPRMKIIGKAMKASEQEVRENVRSRSAVMRVAEKL